MKLCGGTLLTLLSAVKRARGNRVSFLGIRGTVSDPMMLACLLRLMCPDYQVDLSGAFRTQASRYKNCRISYAPELPLNEPRYTEGFHRRVREQYPQVLQSMDMYCHLFLRVEEQDRMEWLVRAILEVILLDPDMAGQGLYISPDGEPVESALVPEMEGFCLPALLVGCLDYIVTHVPLNTEGQETLREWILDKEEIHMAGTLRETIGCRIRHRIEVLMDQVEPFVPEPQSPCPDNADVETGGDNRSVQDLTDAQAPGSGAEKEPTGTMPAGPGQPVTGPNRAWTGTQMFLGINIFAGAQVGQIQYYQMPTTGGSSQMELLSLDTGLYHLFVVEGERFTERSFSLSKSVSLNRHIEPAIRDRFLDLGPMEQADLIRLPAVFATVNREGRETDAFHPALLGRLTGIRVLRHEISFEWKPLCPFPQQLLNRNESLFRIWHAPAASELEEEHWTIKPVPLIRNLQIAGFDPYQRVM
ncbi:MAG: hypothetical protein IJ088_06305 [Clostridia bacterium]|nr:hypothetical protein [Clostridia bacterium]